MREAIRAKAACAKNDKSQTELITDRINAAAIHIRHISEGMVGLTDRLSGDISSLTGKAVSPRPVRIGSLGKLEDAMDQLAIDLEALNSVASRLHNINP